MDLKKQGIAAAALAALAIAPASSQAATANTSLAIEGSSSDGGTLTLYVRVGSINPACRRGRTVRFIGENGSADVQLANDTSSKRGYAGATMVGGGDYPEIHVKVLRKKVGEKTCGSDRTSYDVHNRAHRSQEYPTEVEILTAAAGPSTVGAVGHLETRSSCRSKRVVKFFATVDDGREFLFADVSSKNGFFGGFKAVPAANADGLEIVVQRKKLAHGKSCAKALVGMAQ